MDLTHLKYAVEVEKTKSITRAAENLFMGQPNLSRAIRELERSLGIRIFRRTSTGVIPTEQGEEFLSYAKQILSLAEKIGSIHENSLKKRLCFNISSPEAIYIVQALAAMLSGLPASSDICIRHTIEDNLTIVDNVSQNGHSLGIIRCDPVQDKHIMRLLKDKGLASELIIEFQYGVLMSADHPLAQKESISVADLSGYIEISGREPHNDTMRPLGPDSTLPAQGAGRILTTDHDSRLFLLGTVPAAYMRTPPVPGAVLEQYRLTRRTCSDLENTYADFLIYKKDHELSGPDKKFIAELRKVSASLL